MGILQQDLISLKKTNKQTKNARKKKMEGKYID